MLMKMLINGMAADAADGAVLTVTNPATGAVIDTVPKAAPEDVKKAVQAAKASRFTRRWRS